ncbi:hypothetical protein [Streptomyces griseus]|uniref:hypothetical protein n=1 Tax=Streptomyces griseus TaxID=1911 RepID=UPI00068AE0CA|nr:hypothetical protein [Streptomyces griseus]
MRTALRTALAAALVAGVAATPVLAAGSAFAAGPTPAPKAAAKAAAAAADVPLRTVQLAGGLSAKVYARGDQHPYYTATVLKNGAVLDELKAGAGYGSSDTRIIEGHKVTLTAEGKVTAVAYDPAAGTLLRTVQLAGGLSAKVYEKGDQHPYVTATVLKGGTVLGELKAGAGHPAKETKVFAGYAVTLTSDGKVTATATPADGRPARTLTLIGGATAKIYRINADHHRAEILRDGRIVGRLDANTRSAAGNDNGEFLVLNANGTTYNWVGNHRPGATPGIYRLADGTVLELARRDGRYGLQQIVDDKGRGFTYLAGDRQVWFYGKAVVVLERDGGFAAFVPGAARQAAPQPYGMGGGGQGEQRPADTDPDALGECTVTKFVDIGAGTGAKLIMSPKGPKAKLITAGDEKVIGVLDRAHPSLPKSAGIVARIVDAHSTTPSLYAKTQGGGVTGGTHAFPKLPRGCELDTAAGASRGGGTAPQGGQTSVVPRGGVAAGAELAAEDRSATLVAAGAGAASLAAAGLGFTVLRRRAAADRG